MAEEILFCKGGGCTAKLGPGILARVLGQLPKAPVDDNLLIGFESSDDAAVYRVSEDVAIVQTLDFFPPMVEDPYLFGQIAATNALSDVYAMGGEVKTALNIVCFPEEMDLNILGKIMQGGSGKVIEAGGTLVGGHSIMDSDVKYGLSVMGTIHPEKIYPNNGGREGDLLLFTKKLGTGLICTANRVGAAPEGSFEEAVRLMTTLNRRTCEISHDFSVHACTDVTGFGFLGHLLEMTGDHLSAIVDSIAVPVIGGARYCAEEFLLTAAAQRNRNHVGNQVCFARHIGFAMEEILFDPQTSGGLLYALAPQDAYGMLQKLQAEGIDAAIVGRLKARDEYRIYVT